MRHLVSTLFFLLLSTALLQAQEKGYRIEVEVPDFKGTEAYLAYHFGAQQYIRDTAQVTEGKFTFASDSTEELEGGIYMIVFPPDNQYFEVLVSEDSQHFGVKNRMDDFVGAAEFEGAPENTIFYDYLAFLDKQRQRSAPFQQTLTDSTASKADKEAAQKQVVEIGKEVKAYQEKVVEEHAGTLPANIIRMSWQIEIPERLSELPKEERQKAQLLYYREHFFDNLDFSDGRLVRTPMLVKKLDEFIDRLTVRHPDSINAAVDIVMGKIAAAGNDKEMYKFCASHFLNKYAKSEFMGMDAVYTHIALNYYADGKAFWMKEKEVNRIVNNARRLIPLLIGKTAPNIELKTLEGKPVSLHAIDAQYTIIYFWDPDCGICKKASKELVAVYEKYKDQGVEIFGICNKTYEELDKCGESVKEKNMTWINTADPYGRGQAHAKYDIRANPTLFILDKDKKIIYKQIGAKQIDEILARELSLTGDQQEEE